jgi:hypothetical protein
MDRVLSAVFVSLPGQCKARTVNLLLGSVFACVLVWVVALSLRAISASPYQVSSFRLEAAPQKYQVRSGGDLHKRLADVEARDPTVAQPMLAPSQFPLTHDFDRQNQARFLRALRKSYLKGDWSNIDLACAEPALFRHLTHR